MPALVASGKARSGSGCLGSVRRRLKMQAPSCGGRHGRGPGVVALGGKQRPCKTATQCGVYLEVKEKVGGHLRGVCDLGQHGGDATGPPP